MVDCGWWWLKVFACGKWLCFERSPPWHAFWLNYSNICSHIQFDIFCAISACMISDIFILAYCLTQDFILSSDLWFGIFSDILIFSHSFSICEVQRGTRRETWRSSAQSRWSKSRVKPSEAKWNLKEVQCSIFGKLGEDRDPGEGGRRIINLEIRTCEVRKKDH